jgi:hypothetical protein
MDRFYLSLVCGGIVVLIAALALTAPKDLRDGRPEAALLLSGGQR